MHFRHASRLLAAALVIVPFVSCGTDTAELTVDLPSAATARPQFFHGNCFAGWSVAVELRLRETRGLEVVLDELSYRVFDTGTSEELGVETLDRVSLEARYGSTAAVVPGRSSRSIDLGLPAGARPVGPLDVSGNVSGRDENGRAVDAAFDLETSLTVEGEETSPTGGACP